MASASDRRRVAEITSLSIRKMQELAAAGTIPGAAKLGGVWTFDPVSLLASISDQEPRPSQRVHHRPVVISHSVSTMPDASINAAFDDSA